MKQKIFVLMTLFFLLCALNIYAVSEEKNVLSVQEIGHEKIKASRDDKNVVSGTDERDEDSFIKESENFLTDEEFEFEVNPNPDEREL